MSHSSVSPRSDNPASCAGDKRHYASSPSGRPRGHRFGPARIIAALAASLAACSPNPRDDGLALEDTLRLTIERAYDFTRPDAAERMASLYPDTGHVISASAGHIVTSRDSVRAGIQQFWSGVGMNMREPRWTWGEVHVDRLADDAAVLTATWSIPHIAPTGQPHTIGGAWTAVFRKFDGEWKIVHEHLSEPGEEH